MCTLRPPTEEPSGMFPSAVGEEEMMIAVMGQTGVGKSSFINTVSGSTLPVGNGLRSCTSRVTRSQPFTFSNRRIVMIDTPGFDDTTMSDVDVLNSISSFLAMTHAQGYHLSGVIYMHRISDRKMGGSSQRTLRIFRRLCGEEAFHNVLLVTSMWDLVDLKSAAVREQELAANDQFFRTMLDRGARLGRYNHSVNSGHHIIQQLLRNRPQPLRIQRELVDERKAIVDTDAGREVILGRDELIKRHVIEMEELRCALAQALKDRDMWAAKELEETRCELSVKIQRAEEGRRRMAVRYDADRRKALDELWRLTTALRDEEYNKQLAEREARALHQSLEKGSSNAEQSDEPGTRGRSGWHQGGCATVIIGAFRLLDLIFTIFGDFTHC